MPASHNPFENLCHLTMLCLNPLFAQFPNLLQVLNVPFSQCAIKVKHQNHVTLLVPLFSEKRQTFRKVFPEKIRCQATTRNIYCLYCNVRID